MSDAVMSGAPADARGERAAFRAFVRAHHPDAGGDPERFREGLRTRRPTRPDEDDPRFDAPVVLVPARTGAGRAVRRAARRVRRWRARQAGSSRVR